MKSATYQYFSVLTLSLIIFCQSGLCLDGEKPAKKKEASSPAAKTAGWEIPWLEGTSLSKATIVIKRFGRLQRNEIWDPPAGYDIGGIDYLANAVLALDEKSYEGSPAVQESIREMKSYAYFYRARSRGRKIDAENPSKEELEGVKADLGKAVELGYTNHLEILGSKKELHLIFDHADFKELIRDLAEKAFKRIRDGYAKQVTDGFALFARAGEKSWKPDLKTTGGDAFWPAESPAIVVLSRIHHDGYNKFIGRIEKLAETKGAKPTLRTAFYQMKADNKARLAQTASYVKTLGTTSPYCVIDRGQYRTLRETLKGRYEEGSAKDGKKAVFDIFQPVVIFFDSAGVPIYQTNGVLEDWQIEAVLDGFAAATASAPVKEAEKATPPAKEPGKPAEAEKTAEGAPPAEAGKAKTPESSDN